MNISLDWLKNYVDLPKNLLAKDIGLKMTMATVEVDKVVSLADAFEKIVVGQIKKISVHPNADRLRLVTVDVGEKNIDLVCGGTNLVENHQVVVALIGAKVKWHGEGDLVTIEKTKVRGVDSQGMICAASEIGLEDRFAAKDDHEIIDLTEFGLKGKNGQNIAELLELTEATFEIDNKSINHRPDLWGHYGMAREVAAIYELPLAEYPFEKIKSAKEVNLKVENKEKILCPRYQAVMLDNFCVAESPAWLKEKLSAIGQKPINNLVDITNYVMFDLGQPLHAFAADKIKEKIVVRLAKDKEILKTLDGEEKKLSTDDLVIADKEKALALAGVMGGEFSGINEKTTKIIIESANFEPVNIRKTANRLNLRTEAAIRYEKSLDPNLTEKALARAVSLILSICPQARVVSNVVDENSFKNKKINIEIAWTFINERIGNELSHDYIVNILKRLGFILKINKNGLKIEVPSWRATKDVGIAEDIIEEIVRIYGFDNIKPIMPKVDLQFTEENNLRQFERKVKNILAGSAGFDEVYCSSFENIELLKKIGASVDHVRVANPWSEDAAYLRKNLAPLLLTKAESNQRFFAPMAIFEVAKIFDRRGQGEKMSVNSKNFLPNQDVWLALVATGQDSLSLIKGAIELLAKKMNFDCGFVISNECPVWCHPHQNQKVYFNKVEVGYLANVHPETKEILKIKEAIACAEINLTKAAEFFPTIKKYQSLKKYPDIVLDLSIIVPETADWGDLQKISASLDEKLIRSVDLVEIYKNDKMEEGKKSVTLRLVFGSDERTLQYEEAEKIRQRVVDQLKKAVRAELRQ